MGKAYRARQRDATRPQTSPDVTPLQAAIEAADPQQAMYLAARYTELRRTLDVLGHRDDGWMRVVPDEDTGQIYLKWKFTRGKHLGHYIMAVVLIDRLEDGLHLLVDKLYKVDNKDLRPSKDTAFDGGR
jgi:hypothetical protein